jgi:HIRAN domain
MRELAHSSVDLGAMLLLQLEPSNPSDKNAIQIVNGQTGGVLGHVPARIAEELAATATFAKGGSGCIVGIWRKHGRVVGLRVVGSVGRTFGVTTEDSF